MAPSTPANHDPSLSHNAANAASQQASQPAAGISQPLVSSEMPNVQLAGLDPNQIMTLLRSLPNVFNKVNLSPTHSLSPPHLFTSNALTLPNTPLRLENIYDCQLIHT